MRENLKGSVKLAGRAEGSAYPMVVTAKTPLAMNWDPDAAASGLIRTVVVNNDLASVIRF